MKEGFRIAGQHYLPEDVEARIQELSAQDLEGLELEGLELEVWQFIARWYDCSESIALQTSGSTGRPKLLNIPKRWMRTSAAATTQALGLASGMRALLCISPKYVGGMMMIVRSLELGLDLYLDAPSRQPSTAIPVDFTAMVPLQVEQLLAEGQALSQFGRIIIGGAPLSAQTAARLGDAGTPVYATFGMTETVSHIALRRLDGAARSEHYETLADIRVSSDADGRLIMDIPQFDRLRLQSNDQVEILDPQHFTWLGRTDNAINSGGLKIHPEQVEQLLAGKLDSPHFVHGEAHTEYGQCAVLCLAGEALSEEELLTVLEGIHPSTLRPKRVYLLEEFIHTENGKLRRQASFAQEKRRLI